MELTFGGGSLLRRIFLGGGEKWANFWLVGGLPTIPQYGKPCLPHWEDFPFPLNAINTSGLTHYIQNQKVPGSNPTRCSAWLLDPTLLRRSWWPSGRSKSHAHSVHEGRNPPLKNTTSLFLAKPPLNQQTVQAPLFRHSPPPPLPSVLVFRNPPLPEKSDFSVNPQNMKVLKFFILNTILSFKSN